MSRRAVLIDAHRDLAAWCLQNAEAATERADLLRGLASFFARLRAKAWLRRYAVQLRKAEGIRLGL